MPRLRKGMVPIDAHDLATTEGQPLRDGAGPVHSRIRTALARRVGAAYAGAPNVVAVMVGGSVARGHADRWSDVEIGVVWRDVPPLETRAGLATTAQLQDWRAFPDRTSTGAVEEDGVRDGIKVDLVHLDSGSIGAVLAAVEAGDPALDKQVLAASLVDGVPLAGATALRPWRARAEHYPDALRIAMVRDHLVFGPHAWLEMLADRDDVLALHDILGRIARSVVLILLAVNRVYVRSPELKWLPDTLARCPIAPPELDRRIDASLRTEPHLAVAEARRLIDETLELIDLHVPEVDTGPVRRRIAALPRGVPGSFAT